MTIITPINVHTTYNQYTPNRRHLIHNNLQIISMTKKTLPPFYYLEHFNLMLQWINATSLHLLRPQDQTWLHHFSSQPKTRQAMLVRLINRKSNWINRATLRYSEIPNITEELTQLEQLGWINQSQQAISTDDALALIRSSATKEILIQLLMAVEYSAFKKSQTKPVLLQQLDSIDLNHLITTPPFKQFAQPYIQLTTDTPSYLQFLFFGDVKSTLSAYALRDLGVRRTHSHSAPHQHRPRFSSIAEAQSAYQYSQQLKDLPTKHDEQQIEKQLEQLKNLPLPVGSTAQQLKDRWLYKLGMLLNKADHNKTIDILCQSNDPRAIEQRIRLAYQRGDKALAKEWVQTVLNAPANENLLLFAEDFYARKFQGEKRSPWTEMLRTTPFQLNIDPSYQGMVELGAINVYQRQGLTVYHTENRLWRALFALTFWPELFEDAACAPLTEFDGLPAVLTEGNFYDLLSSTIEQRLNALQTATQHQQLLIKMAAQHYGKPNGLFRWSATLLEALNLFIAKAPRALVLDQLKAMTQQTSAEFDGFPDLMVMNEKTVWFEEIKSPNDQLRKNQLITIRHLQQIGFDVRLTKVNWSFDPLQPFCVVDVETTGGRADEHRVIEIGVVTVINGRITDSWSQLINPQRPIGKFITHLTGISNDMVADQPYFAEIAPALYERLSGSIFVAHNAAFDYGFVQAEMARCDRRLKLPTLCTVKTAKQNLPGNDSYSLKALTERLNIDLNHHHRALDDATATAHILIHLQSQMLEKIN